MREALAVARRSAPEAAPLLGTGEAAGSAPRAVANPMRVTEIIGTVRDASRAETEAALATAAGDGFHWSAQSAARRARVLDDAAQMGHAAPHAAPPAAAESAGGAASPSGVIDWSALLERYGGRHAFVDKLAATARAAHGDVPARLRAARDRQDYKELAFLGHTLKSLAGNFMADGVQTLASRLEAAARETREDTLALAGELAEAVQALLDELSRR